MVKTLSGYPDYMVLKPTGGITMNGNEKPGEADASLWRIIKL